MKRTPKINRYASPLKARKLSAAEYREKTGERVGSRAFNELSQSLIDHDHALLTKLVEDTDTRASFARVNGVSIDALSVWNDFTPELYQFTQTNISSLDY